MSSPASAYLTTQQRLAVSARQESVVLSSGAGCGKTHVLTQRQGQCDERGGENEAVVHGRTRCGLIS